jgi:hypothetical protein
LKEPPQPLGIDVVSGGNQTPLLDERKHVGSKIVAPV